MRSILALVVMFLVPLVLPILPLPGLPGLAVGLLGGYIAGSAGRALLLAMLPFLVVTLAIGGLGFGTGLPLLGTALAGIALIWLVFEHLALVVGALIGGAIAAWRQDHPRPTPASWQPMPPADAGRASARPLPPAGLEEPHRMSLPDAR